MSKDQDKSNQTLQGDGNVQVGRDLNVNSHNSQFDNDNPYKVECPQCEKQTGRYSALCLNCGFSVKEHFDNVDYQRRVEERDRRDANHFLGGIVTIVIGAIASYLLDQSAYGFSIILFGFLIMKVGFDININDIK